MVSSGRRAGQGRGCGGDRQQDSPLGIRGRFGIRVPCPICGERDRREFTYLGSDAYLDRPTDVGWSESWDAYLHQRENRAGPVKDLWYHEAGCAAWLLVERDTVTHAVAGAVLASEARR